MKGEHLLHKFKGEREFEQVLIKSIGNLTLRGEDNHTRNDVIIRCSNTTKWLLFRKSGIISIYGITITGCGGGNSPLLSFHETESVLIHSSIIRDNNGRLRVTNTDDLHIEDVIFSNNFCNCSLGAGIGRCGGALQIENTNVTIVDCLFANNTSLQSQGGGACIKSRSSDANITIANTVFINNSAHFDGGGLFVRLEKVLEITNSSFISNAADNGGSGVGIFISLNVPKIQHAILSNVIIRDNNGTGLLLSCGNFNTIELSQIRILNNTDSGIHAATYCILNFAKGQSVIANNSSPTDGGGLYLERSSSMKSISGSNISFVSNTAKRFGGAIYSADVDHERVFNRYIYTSYDCTLGFDMSAVFSNNRAGITGDILYGGTFLTCRDGFLRRRNTTSHFIQCKYVPSCIKKLLPSSSSSQHQLASSEPVYVCPCTNGSVNCNKRSIEGEVYSGQVFSLSLITVGLCAGVSPGGIVTTHTDQYDLHIISTEKTSTTCTTHSYIVRLTTYIPSTTLAIDVADGYLYNSVGSMNVHLAVLQCPLGLILESATGNCICNDEITEVSGVQCNISWMPHPIQRSGSNWISHLSDKNCTVAHTGCPFDYCNMSPVKISLNESDLQCNYNRSGILCGQCQSGLSLILGSNRCSDCTNTNIYITISLVILLMLAGVGLVLIVKVLNLTISNGSINGILFYAYIVKLNSSVYFPRGNVPVISQFIAWINLDLGIECCFVDGLNGYWKTWLQLAFPLYLWCLVAVIIVACKLSGRLSRLWALGGNSISVVATLILMPYTKMLRDITNMFSISRVACENMNLYVWSVDGNISYLSGKHAILLAVSSVSLLVGVVYIGLILAFQWLQRYSGKCCKGTRDPIVRLKPLLDVYTGPYKDRYRFWTGLCLVLHLCLTVLFALTTGTYSHANNYIICATVFFLTSITLSQKSIRLRHREMLSYINLFLLALLSALFSTNQSATHIITIVSVSIELLVFSITATSSIRRLVREKWLGFLHVSWKRTRTSHDQLPNDAAAHELRLENDTTPREPLIFETSDGTI